MAYEIVVVGTSWGGLSALRELIVGFPAALGVPVVVVQHRHRQSDHLLTTLLQDETSLCVCEVEDKAPMTPGNVYVAPADYHLLIEADRSFAFSSEPPVSFARPSIDVLMNSAADAYGPALAGVLLTGANMDGAEGMAAIRAHGGLTIVQQPQDADVPTMPEAAIARSQPDHVLPLRDITPLLLQLGNAGDAP